MRPRLSLALLLLATAAHAQPANDAFTSLERVPGEGTVTGTTVGATLQPGEAAPTCRSADGASIWYDFTAPGTGFVTFDFGASDFDTVAVLYEDTFPALPEASDEIACSDDADGTPQSRIENAFVQAAQFYVVRVSGGAGAQGAVSFDYSFSTSTAGDAAPGTGAALSASPNPLRSGGTVTLSVPTTQTVAVAVFDALGRRVATLHDGAVAAGDLPLSLDASALPSGVYIVRAIGETVCLSERVTVVR